MQKVLIIAEIGCNHNGDKKLARRMIEEAVKCGVDAIKFQTFNSEALISKYAPKAEYQKKTTGTEEGQLEMTKKLELSHEDFLELATYARSLGVIVFSTPFDMGSIDFLEKWGQSIWKIPSGEITNLPYLERIGAIKCKDKRVLLSSGMATIEEIGRAIDVLVRNGTKRGQITLLHCNTEYPTPDKDVNLSAISDLRLRFPEIQIGFSDHSLGYTGAIEKHFTLDRNLPGPDHKASIEPEDLSELVKNVRRMELMIGCGQKIVTESEAKNKIVARKSIVASRKIEEGEVFSEENITCKRPGNGISPMNWYDLIGKKAEKSFEEDQLIEDSRFSNQE